VEDKQCEDGHQWQHHSHPDTIKQDHRLLDHNDTRSNIPSKNGHCGEERYQGVRDHVGLVLAHCLVDLPWKIAFCCSISVNKSRKNGDCCSIVV
jgi:hypothetical protein